MFRSRDRIEIKSADQIQVMRAAGLVVARTLQRVAEITAPGITTVPSPSCAEGETVALGCTTTAKQSEGHAACSSLAMRSRVELSPIAITAWVTPATCSIWMETAPQSPSTLCSPEIGVPAGL